MTTELVGERRETATLPVIPPAIPREEAGEGRVGAVAYPYRVYEAEVTIARPILADKTDTYVASVDRSRRLVVRADSFPDPEERELDDVLVLPDELSDEETREKARKSVFQWTLRRYSLAGTPDIEFARCTDAYKLFWLVDRPKGTAIVDSLRGDEEPLYD